MRLEQAKSVQRALCVTADGDFGSKTRQAIRRFEASDSSSTPELVSNRNGELDVTEWTQLIGVGNCTAPFQNALERFRYSFKSSGFSQPDSGLVGGYNPMIVSPASTRSVTKSSKAVISVASPAI